MADIYNIQIDAGATYQLSVPWEDDTGTPINLTGYTARMHLRRDIGDESPALALSVGSGISIDAPAGTISIQISSTATAGLSGSYVYDLEVESGGGVVDRLIEGTVTISPEVTRA